VVETEEGGEMTKLPLFSKKAVTTVLVVREDDDGKISIATETAVSPFSYERFLLVHLTHNCIIHEAESNYVIISIQ